MRTCKVEPSDIQCKYCMSAAAFADTHPDCAGCVERSRIYELADFGMYSNNTPYAVVIYDGKASIVDLYRVHDIKTVEDKKQ